MSEDSPTYHRGPERDPTAEEILSSAAASVWLQSALRAALLRDPVDAAADAALLARVLGSRADAVLALDLARLGLRRPPGAGPH